MTEKGDTSLDDIAMRVLFDAIPVSVRVEDFSAVKIQIDELGIADAEAFSAYLDQHPEFIDKAAKKIRVVDANTAALALHQMETKQEFIDTVTRSFSEKNLRAIRGGLEAIHAGKTLLEFETSIERADGTIRLAMVRWTVPPGNEETYARTLLTSTDITELRQTEEMLRHSQRLEVIGQIAGGVAHDFNNLLAVILGNAELLHDEKAYREKVVNMILHASHRGAELTQRLLAYAGSQTLDPQVIDLERLVTTLRELIGRTLGPNVEIVVDLEESLWPVMADPGQVESALLNLALNARDAMPEGGCLTISGRNSVLDQEQSPEIVAASDLNGEFVRLSITDTGGGMSGEVRTRAFEPFYSTKETGEGSGLGLSMVYGFAKQSGGQAEIESAPGSGTTVSLYLPRSPTPVTRVAQNEPETPLGHAERVLVVEDDRDVGELVVTMLQSLNYRTIITGQVEDAWSVLEGPNPIDLVITDVMLPGKQNGLDLSAELARQRPDLPVVFISGYSTEAIQHTGPDGPERAFLNKPFRRRALAQTLRAALD